MPSGNAKLAWDADSNTARWDLSDLNLAPGWYELSLGAASSELQLDGNADGLAGDPLEMRVRITQRGDLDLDGDVDSLDLTLLAENWTGLLAEGSGSRTRTQGDLDGDGDTDAADLAELILNWTGLQAQSTTVATGEGQDRAAAADQVFAQPSGPDNACTVKLPRQ
jgi:hypothetical protein